MVSSRLYMAVLLLSASGADALAAQARTVTLSDAIRLAERVQPAVVRATAGVRTASAQRRSALGAYLPTVSASSSASDFFSEGAGRVDPITGQLTSGNSTNRSVNASLAASLDLFTGFPPWGRNAGGSCRRGRRVRLPD